MLAKLGCTYVLAGHSERRQYHGEDDATVSAKAHAAMRAGLVPIICVGETLEVREADDHIEHTMAQIDGGLKSVTAEQAAGVVIAYEPVWAIGTGKVATPEDAQEMCGAIRARVSGVHGPAAGAGVRILYGGSVKSGNMPEIMAQPDIDGGLVGGASLDAGEFARICRYREVVA
jgi:triosephosphate isomerase (TIM)